MEGQQVMEMSLEKDVRKYILIQNDGEIESNSFELIGASTKRNDSGKIGFFGSGLKYSIAYMMRKGISFKVFSGLNEMVFTTKAEKLKEQDFERICINGNETSFTTTMGPTWTKDWFVLREIYCNAIDETNCQLVKSAEHISPSEGKTRIYIELTEELKEVSQNWDTYFADERTPLFVSEEIYTSYLGHEDQGGVRHQPVSVYAKTEGVLYRKGIQVYKTSRYTYDYGCNNVDINEDRTAKSANGLQYAISNLFAKFCNEEYIKSILRTAQDDKQGMEYLSLGTDSCSDWSLEWARFSKENMLVVKDISGRYAEEIAKSRKEVFLLPVMFARDLKKNVPDALVVGMTNVVNGSCVNEIQKTPKMEFLLKETLESLSEMKYEVHYEIDVVEFDEEEVLGQADLKEKRILLSSKLFDMGRREIAMTLMEENEHIKSGKGDETRAFQNHIFSQWLKTMEDSNGLFL